MKRSINQSLARIAHPESENLGFPFSRMIDGDWYDCATDGHRLIAVESAIPHYNTEIGPDVKPFLVPRRQKFRLEGVGLEELIDFAKACPKYKGRGRQLKLMHGEDHSATVNPDLLLDILAVCEEDALIVSVNGPSDPVRVDGILTARIGDHNARVLGVVMPVRAAQEELPWFAQLTLSYLLPADEFYGDIVLSASKAAESKKAAAE